MVGTTRLRISTFMRQFLELGLIEFSAEGFLCSKLNRNLNQIGVELETNIESRKER